MSKPVAAEEEQAYQAQDAVASTINTTAVMSAAGLFFSAVQNSLARANTPALGVITRSGGTIATFGTIWPSNY